ncbi:MAG: response regulator transcription factor [Akkermansiaceae bacterium]|jgi:DNA-binding NarL/FixJ family response regulator|nr:response regulator transcription factor [Akkermansiaceae bacterium]
MRILIIDDHALVRRGMISLLKDHFNDVEVGEASDSKAGLAAANVAEWDLVLVDITMPGRNGLGLLQDIKRDHPTLPVLMISAHSEKDYALRALKLGAAGFISKQSATELLVAAVQRVLSGRRYISPVLAEQLAGALAGESWGAAHESLSNRELQVLRMIASGKSIKEIASDLALSAKTVATYRSRIAEKMGLSSNVELTRYAMQHHLSD